MTTAIYLAAVDPRAGRSLVALGLLEALTRRSDAVGYFRPVALSDDDRRTALAMSRADLGDRVAHAWTDAEVDELLSSGRQDELFRGVIAAYRDLADRCDVVLIEGTDTTGARAALEFDFNARVANHLSAWMIAVVRGGDREPADVAESVKVTAQALAQEGVATAAVIANRIRPDDVDEVTAALADVDVLTPVIPESTTLAAPTLAEVVHAAGGRPLREGQPTPDVEVSKFTVAAMSLGNVLARLEDGAVVITPGDRGDVLVGVVASRAAETYPDVAGVLLTGGFTPAAEVLSLAEGLGGITLPLFAVDDDTFDCARKVAEVQPAIHAGDERKIAGALRLFAEHVDMEALLRRLEVPLGHRRTPLMFEYELVARARADRKHIVLPEGTDERILRAAVLLRRRDVVDLTLLGPEREVRRAASAAGASLPDDVRIVDPSSDERLEAFADAYVEARAHKGMVKDRALEVMTDVSYFGTMMVHLGHADGMVSGAAHTTAHTIRPAFEFVGTRPGVEVVSSVFLMCLADRVLVYGDCAIIPNPTVEQLADIAIASAGTARTFGVDPVVAMLSYSSGGSGSGEDVERVREATARVRSRAPDLAVEGPIQYDAAVDVGVGAKKLPDSAVAGRATVFVFPDLNTGNNTYKAVQRSAGAVAIGPVLQGLVKPVNDLSRGCTVADVLNTVAITAVQAQEAGRTAPEPSS